MMPGLMVLILAPRLAHRTASAITRSEFPRLASWLAFRESVTRSGRSMGSCSNSSAGVVAERGVLVGGEGSEAIPGLRGDDDPGAPPGDDVSELLEHECRAVEVDGEDGRWGGLAG